MDDVISPREAAVEEVELASCDGELSSEPHPDRAAVAKMSVMSMARLCAGADLFMRRTMHPGA